MIQKFSSAVFLLFFATLYAACGTAPLSFIEGNTGSKLLAENQSPVRVVSIDGHIQFRMPVQISAGPHTLVLESAPRRGVGAPLQRTFAFKVEPCTRYFFIATPTTPMDTNWELAIHTKEPVGACNSDAEVKKGSSIS
jgi:hypothetical protein